MCGIINMFWPLKKDMLEPQHEKMQASIKYTNLSSVGSIDFYIVESYYPHLPFVPYIFGTRSWWGPDLLTAGSNRFQIFRELEDQGNGPPNYHEGLRTRVTVLGMIFVLGTRNFMIICEWIPILMWNCKKTPRCFSGFKVHWFEGIWKYIGQCAMKSYPSVLKTTSNKITLFGCQTWKCW